MERGSIEQIEAAYAAADSDKEWLAGLAATMKRGHDLGVCAYTYAITKQGTILIDTIVGVGEPAGVTELTPAMMAKLPAAYVRETWATFQCTTAAQSGPPETRAQTRAAMEQFYGQWGMKDILVVNALDPTGRGVYLGGLSSRELALSRRDQTTGSRVAAHLAAAYRLRRARADSEPEAIITPTGRIEHTLEPASSETARNTLRSAALAIDRARSKRHRRNDTDVVELWQALISGRWTLVDRIDSDGKRFFVARKNDPDVARHHALTRRERQVVGFAALGHSNKLIAYEMGLSVSTVAVYLSVAAEKLGVSSRAELIHAAQAFGAVDD